MNPPRKRGSADAGWTRTTLRKLKLLVDPSRLGRWGLLVLLALAVSGLELLGTVVVFALFGAMTDPGSDVGLPLVGSVGELFPNVSDERMLLYLAVAVAVFFVVRGFVILFQTYAQGRVTQNAGARIADRLLRGYLAMPYEWHLTRDSAEMFRNAYSAVGTLVNQVLVPALSAVTEALVVLAILTALFIVQPVASLLTVLVLLPTTVLLLRLVQKRLTALGREQQESSRASIRSLRESLDAIRDVTLFQRMEDFRQTFWTTRSDLARIGYLRNTLGRMPKLIMETLLVLLVAGFVVFTVVTERSMSDTLAVLGLFGYAVFRIMPSLSTIVQNMNEIRFGQAVIDDLHEDLVVTEPHLARSLEDTGEDVEPLHLHDEIRVDAVSYGYPGADRPALTDVSLVIRAGESVGIVGHTGGGKSTLIDVLLGLLEPTSGQVLIDGRDLDEHRKAWQRTVSLVPQSLFLMNDSIRRNVAFTYRDDTIDDERVWHALRQAQLADFVADLPEALGAEVGYRGIRLSGGQRQRIAIARALYHDPDVLVFDEGTASLDQRTEADLLHAVEGLMGERTLIHVAHRLATVRSCDRIFLIEDGHLVAKGTFEELMAEQPSFRDMVET